MSAASGSPSGGVGILGLLGVVFVTLKLLGVITWSWWWVTAPFWGGLFLGLLIVIFGVPLVLWLDHRRAKRPRARAY